MYGLKVYITPEDILDKLCDEDKKRFNQCVFTNVERDRSGSITIDCLVFDDPDPYVREQHRQKYFSDGSLEVTHGHWIEDYVYDPDPHDRLRYKCSECGLILDGVVQCFTYCPNCGAKMKG